MKHHKQGTKIDLSWPEFYINRELSWLEFNARVLDEAADNSHPLLERLKFLIIFSANLDEFFMIRVSGLKEQVAGLMEISSDDMPPEEQLMEIRMRLLPMLQRHEQLLVDDVLPALAEENIEIHPFEKLSHRDRAYFQDYFESDILPVLTPLALDLGHPFPRLLNRSLNIIFVLKDDTKDEPEQRIAVLQLPTVLTRLVRMKRVNGHHFVLLEQIIQANAATLFPGLTLVESHAFRVTRDADTELAEDEAGDLLTAIAEQVRQRRAGTAAVRLEINDKMPEYLINLLKHSLDLEPEDVYSLRRPLNLPDLMELVKIDVRALKDPAFTTRTLPEFAEDQDVFEAIGKQDLMVHHPFDSFSNSVVRFIAAAAIDPKVLAIKITLYRAGGNSPVVAALKTAAENGKDVTAFVELKARFDEENNIIWARELEQAGAHVVYGVMGLKTHSKIAMVVRREGGKLRTYLHFSTGNYNQVSARIYTDIGYFTAREEFASDAIHLFNFLTGYSHRRKWDHLIVAPIGLRQRLMEMIHREIENHSAENPGVIWAKMNSLVDDDIIKALYKASQKGVQIRLLIRGICCLRPGIAGVSENIEVRSIIGRFLEHSRIFIFKNGGDEEMFISSADWMPRNLDRRVELMVPIFEPRLKDCLKNILQIYWQDNVKSRRLLSDGNYENIKPAEGEPQFSAQNYFLKDMRAKRKTRVSGRKK
ncbi:MAG: polyphosphate kinase 1 [Bacteroidota bacterium]